MELYPPSMYGGKFAIKKASLKKRSKNLHKKDHGDVAELTNTNIRTALFWAKSAIFSNPFLIVIWKAGLCLPNQPLENGTNVSLSLSESIG